MIFSRMKNRIFVNRHSNIDQSDDHKTVVESTDTSNENPVKSVIHTIDSIRYEDIFMKPEWDEEGLKIPTVIDNTPFYFNIPREVIAEMLNDLLKFNLDAKVK